jgi:hypothetical protein
MGKPIFQDDLGHYLAEAAYQRNKSGGHFIRQYNNVDEKKRYRSGLDDPSKERDIATGIYNIVSSQRILIKDAGSLIEKVLKEHECRHILVRGKRLPLAKAKGFFSDLAICLLVKYNLPIEPAEDSGLVRG